MSRTRDGLWTQLRNPPGGTVARRMLTAQFIDRTGSGVWNSAAVLYFTVEAGLDAQRVGVMLGLAAAVGVFGSPVAGRLAAHIPARTVLIGAHLLRLCALLVILSSTSFAVLLPAVAVTLFGDRAARMLEMLFAAEVAGPDRATYQGLFRSVANAAYALGAGIAALALTVGTRDAYRVLILLDALSFVAAAVQVRRIPASVVPAAAKRASAGASGLEAPAATSPWRDRGYLRFVFLDVFMSLDDSILNVGLPLWLLTRTSAPHALVPVFLIVNTVLVVVLQMRVSAATRGPREATTAVRRYGVALLACCGTLALAPFCGPWLSSLLLIAAALLVTLAELMRSVSSWELAVSLAPSSARAAYLGVAGMSQSTQKSLGPLVLTGAVLTTGPVGWLALGTVVLGACGMQRRGCLRRLEHVERAVHVSTLPTPVDVTA
ncbi:MFS transporter [Actinospica durhamensis]|uniref:MFS transporter n=1 Tax=Actinospica durhamensis TaxID=1508375 RepID=A0A941EMD6_9ACTN|nr:MFS transporter [Actinospica durhamensis]MBR7833182.1 MFS transporter [Actinospica durhamensis]